MKPTVLIIRDGWGENHNPAQDKFNAVKLANLPVSRKIAAEWPRTEIAAHGLDVGVPVGVMGNSEVGHQNIGAGRIVDQEIVRIDKGLSDPAFKNNPAFRNAVANVKKTGGKLHFFGLASDGAVHSTLRHLYSLLAFAKAEDLGADKIFVHAFMDGRDTSPTGGLAFIREIEAELKKLGTGKIASVCGRFWIMDRDNRWERVKKGYDVLTGGEALEASSAEAAVQAYYDKPLDDSRKGDEFVLPTRVVTAPGKPIALIGDGDSVIFFNYRGDRPREITRAFIDDKFDGFQRKKLDLFYVTMTEYQKGLCPNVLFLKPPKMVNILGEWVAKQGIAQFRTAETEKYPHVTFFFNDYREEPFPLEDREVVPSPKDVATYDQKPEMSSVGVTAAAKNAILSGKYGLIVINYANPDMVGHTGSIPAVIKACEAVDRGLGELLEAIDSVGGNALVTADHGNADQMWDTDEHPPGPHTRHTLNPVEVVIYGSGAKGRKMAPLSTGRLADIAPTLLTLMGVPQPPEMTGKSLIVE
ncbi:MAG: 2,3-bisphosphoglycerate-independent phosphoglycerate mutase [Puniceicoccales bacterium]|jgi:2,3-bisphosphoglycerate-independent phosphoglycerate mutase|nr:2,3-bisphosphoglycerate-independent phosphoglycerate mutase [Puniceicoccales bacterium]